MIKEKLVNKALRVLDKFLNVIIGLFFLIVIWLLLQVFCFSSYKIPSDSMAPSLLPGDYVLVNKWMMGGRMFNVVKSLHNEPFSVFRLPGYSSINRNDIIVFNHPYPDNGQDSIRFDLLFFYIKRCIALPGDTLQIRDAHCYVKGINECLGDKASQQRLACFYSLEEKDSLKYVFHDAYPYDSVLQWSIKNFGPLYVPRKGDEIEMNRTHALLYKPIIEWEQKKKLIIEEEVVWLGEDRIASYCFNSNYFFVAGDDLTNSHDSRYWGLLPEDFIAGKAWKIWKSVDPENGKWRWNRIMKKVN